MRCFQNSSPPLLNTEMFGGKRRGNNVWIFSCWDAAGLHSGEVVKFINSSSNSCFFWSQGHLFVVTVPALYPSPPLNWPFLSSEHWLYQLCLITYLSRLLFHYEKLLDWHEVVNQTPIRLLSFQLKALLLADVEIWNKYEAFLHSWLRNF